MKPELKYQRAWRNRGYSFDVGSVTVQRSAAHCNKKDLVMIVVDGELQFTFDNYTFIAECDTEVFIPARSEYAIKNIGDRVSKVYFGYKSI